MNWADQRYAIGRGLAAVRHKHGTRYQPYVRAVVEYGLRVLLGLATGSTFPSVSGDDIRGIGVPDLELEVQLAISQFIGSLDDKIEQNRQTGRKLEELARAVFKAWFVDFEPVKAKAAGATAFPGMLPETFATLPTRFTDTQLGPVPEGWRPVSVGDLVEDIYDGPHATPPESHDGAIFLGIKNLTGTRVDLSDIRRINETDWPRWTKRVEPRADDIVFTYEATIGFFAIIPPNLRCCLGRRMALMRPKAGVSARYLFHYAISNRFQQLLVERTVYGSTVNRTSLLEFPKYPILIPTGALMWSSMHAGDAESHKLATLRDYLLPRLLSGRVRTSRSANTLNTQALSMEK
jgi:type I restriction enzyme S subunit